MAKKQDADTEAERVLADVPDRRDRGWRGLVTDNSERIMFGGVVGALAFLGTVTAVFGLPGLLLSFLLLTLLCFCLLIIISMGN